MSPEEIRALRKELSYTQRDLAEALGTPVETVRAWERDEEFPTKASVTAMEALRANPPKRAPKRSPTVWQLLADPTFLGLLRRMLHHPKLRAEVERLAAAYPDPLDE
jgi:transcriptional regulator with XRE-family HTH domain